jgi:hypothetical protein
MIDLSAMLSDSDFCEPLAIYNRAQTIGENGVATSTSTPVSPAPYGSVQSGANPELIRGTDYATAGNLITVYTKQRLRAADMATQVSQTSTDAFGNPLPLPAGNMADVIVYRGNTYEVMQLQDWTAYGAGFVSAICRQVTSDQALIND